MDSRGKDELYVTGNLFMTLRLGPLEYRMQFRRGEFYFETFIRNGLTKPGMVRAAPHIADAASKLDIQRTPQGQICRNLSGSNHSEFYAGMKVKARNGLGE